MDSLTERVVDPWYWIDAFPAILITLGVLWLLYTIIGFLVWLWNQIILFFQPTQNPAPPAANPGPSPYNLFWGCVLAVIVGIGLVFGAVIVIVYMVDNMR